MKNVFIQISTAWGIGLVIGPALGGFLAQVVLFFLCNAENYIAARLCLKATNIMWVPVQQETTINLC